MIEKTTAKYNESNNPNVNKSSKRKLLTDKENSATEDSREPRNKRDEQSFLFFQIRKANLVRMEALDNVDNELAKYLKTESLDDSKKLSQHPPNDDRLNSNLKVATQETEESKNLLSSKN